MVKSTNRHISTQAPEDNTTCANRVKSDRNKTIDIPLDKCIEYFDRCLKVEDNNLGVNFEVSSIINRTICANTLDIISLMPEKFADLLIVDPPYNLRKDYGGQVFCKTNGKEYGEFTKSWLLPSLKLLKKNASLYICCDWQSGIVIGDVLTDFESQGLLTIQNRITWEREKGRGAKSNWKNSMEDIWFATISDDYVFNLDDVKIRRRVVAPYKTDGAPKDWEQTDSGNFRNTCPGNFWDDISIPYWSMSENTSHPTQKPEKLLAKLILASSNPGDVVFDPFLGSGTASVVAKKLGRQYCGIEQNPQYCAWAELRLDMAKKDNSIQGYTDGVFWERNTSSLQKKKLYK